MGFNNGYHGIPFLSSENDSYSILGEAYVEFKKDKTIFKLGRQELETPYANTDDIGMIPNTFEAYIVRNNSIKDTTLIFGQVQKWAGVDSSLEKFSKIN